MTDQNTDTKDKVMETSVGQASPTEQELKDLTVAFDILDCDKSGCVNPRKLGSVMKSLGLSPTEAEIQDLISVVDKDGSGTISLADFQQTMTPKLREPIEPGELAQCFEVFDRDGNGLITEDDLAGLLCRLGLSYTKQEVADMLRAADSGGDRRVTFDDFLSVFNDT